MKPFKNGDIVAIKPLGLGGEVTDASRPDDLIEVRIAEIIGHDNQIMTSIRKETFPPESLEHINLKKGVITLQPSTNTPDTPDNIMTEKHLKSFILNGKKFTPKECPWINAIEGYDDWNYQTENEWKREGYELRTSAHPVPMRPFEDADYLLLYYDRKSVFCPLTYKMTRSIQERARDMGKNSYKNKLKALEEYIEQNRE